MKKKNSERKRFSSAFSLLVFWGFFFRVGLALCGDLSTEYTVPLRFDVFRDGSVDQETPRIKYDLSNGEILKLGPLVLDKDALQVTPRRSGRKKYPLLSVSLPKLLMETNVEKVERSLEVFNRTGRSIYRFTALKGEIEETDAKKFYEAIKVVRDPFRFCWRLQVESESARFCTAFQTLSSPSKSKGGEITWAPTEGYEEPPKILLNKQEAPDKNEYAFEQEGAKQITFFARLKTGEVFEFFGSPPTLDLVEMTKSATPEKVSILGYGIKPLGRVKVVSEHKTSKFLKMILWEDTIGDFRSLWQAEVPEDHPNFYVLGKNGMPYLYRFVVHQLPEESFRPYLNRSNQNFTYKKEKKIFGIANRNLVKSMSSKEMALFWKKQSKSKSKPQTQVQNQDQNQESTQDRMEEFKWVFSAPQSSKYNVAHLNLVTNQGESFTCVHEVFRFYQKELSYRLGLSGAMGSSTAQFTHELAFNYWFEDLWGWSNYYLSDYRWGIGMKFFQTLGALSVEEGTLPTTLSTKTFDLKYRLTPGLWGQDETWGLSLNYNDFSLSPFNTKMVGGGIFWARSMPKLFDNLFNIIPWFRYPKWVDFEYIIYAVNLSSEETIPTGSPPWTINFHGKMMITPRFFLEAGFGAKTTSLTQVSGTGGTSTSSGQQDSGLGLDIALLYASMGLGWNF